MTRELRSHVWSGGSPYDAGAYSRTLPLLEGTSYSVILQVAPRTSRHHMFAGIALSNSSKECDEVDEASEVKSPLHLSNYLPSFSRANAIWASDVRRAEIGRTLIVPRRGPPRMGMGVRAADMHSGSRIMRRKSMHRHFG